MNRQPAPYYGRILQIPMGDEARLGITEDMDLASEWEHARSWKGVPIFYPPPYDKIGRVTWSASSAAILEEPAFDRLQPQTRLTLHCIGRKTAAIPPGQLAVTTYFPIVPGTTVVASLEATGVRVPVNVAGNTITLQSAQADTVVVRYRPVFDCFIVKWSGAAQSLEATQTWSATFEQWVPLS